MWNLPTLLASMSPILLLALAEHKLPAGWKTCRASDPNLDKCLKSAIQKAIRQLRNGNSYLGMPPLDPFLPGPLHLNRGGKGPLHLDMTLTDTKISGQGKAKLLSVQANLTQGSLTMQFRTSFINNTAKYRVRGRVLLLPIKGEGHLNFKYEKVQLTLGIQGHRHKFKQGSKDYFKIDNVDFSINPQKVTTVFNDINPTHAEKAELVSRLVSENSKLIVEDLLPSTSVVIAKRVKDYIAPIFDIPYDDLFPN